MRTPDAVIILDQVRYHAKTGLRRISEDRDGLKMSLLITLEAKLFQLRHITDPFLEPGNCFFRNRVYDFFTISDRGFTDQVYIPRRVIMP